MAQVNRLKCSTLLIYLILLEINLFPRTNLFSCFTIIFARNPSFFCWLTFLNTKYKRTIGLLVKIDAAKLTNVKINTDFVLDGVNYTTSVTKGT